MITRACVSDAYARDIIDKLPKVLRFRFFLYICGMKYYDDMPDFDRFDDFDDFDRDYKPTMKKPDTNGDFIDYFYVPIILIVVVAICILLQLHYGIKIV